MKNWKKLLILGFIAALIGGSIGIYLWNKPVTSTSKLDADLQITATALFDAYVQDETGADATYLGKVLEVSGTLKEIRTTDNGKPALVLETSDAIFGVLCEFEDEAVANALEPGSSVTIKGVCSGMLFDVVLNRCVIQ